MPPTAPGLPHPPADRVRFAALPVFRGQWVTVVVSLPLEHVSFLCAHFEGIDNSALVRTPDQTKGRVHIYAWEAQLPLVRRVLTALSMDMPIEIEEVIPGMHNIADWD